jgi:uncharacterized membrane protein
MKELFLLSPSLIVFLHVVSAIIWVGGMIVIRFAIHYSMQNIAEPKIKLERTLENLQRFFKMVIPAIIILVLTATIMFFGLGFDGPEPNKFIHMKEGIWWTMTIIFVFIYIKRNKAQKAFEMGDMIAAKANLAPIAQYLIPINIVLGLIAVYLGITLRGF